MTTFLVLMILNAGSGEIVEEKLVGMYQTLEACVTAQAAKGVSHAKDGKIAVYACRVIEGATSI